jgi:hypothetical protein
LLEDGYHEVASCIAAYALVVLCVVAYKQAAYAPVVCVVACKQVVYKLEDSGGMEVYMLVAY